MTAFTTKITAAAAAIAVAAGGALAATAVQADAAVRAAVTAVTASASAADETPIGTRGSITFRGQRYVLSNQAIVSTTPTTIRIADDAAMTQQGVTTGFYVQFAYAADASKPKVLRVSSGIAIRGYDFATGAYDKSQAVQLGQSTLAIDSARLSEATHAWGHLNSPTERGVEIDIHGIHPGPLS